MRAQASLPSSVVTDSWCSAVKAGLRDHLDGMAGTLLVAGGAAGAQAVVEAVAFAGPELDDGVLRAGGEAAVALVAVTAGQAARRLVPGLRFRDGGDDLAEVLRPRCRRALRFRLRESPLVEAQTEHVPRYHRVLRRGLVALAAQPCVDMARGFLAVPHAHGDGALGGHHVAAGEYALVAGHHPLVHHDGAVLVAFDAFHGTQEAGVGVLAEREAEAVRLEGLRRAGGTRTAVLVEFHHLHGHVGGLQLADGAQPVDADAFLLGVGSLEGVGRHVLPVAPVHDERLVRAQAARHPGRIHGGVAAAVDRDAPAEPRRTAAVDVTQERDGVHDPAGVPGRYVDALAEMGADGDENGVEAALRPLSFQVLHLVIQL